MEKKSGSPRQNKRERFKLKHPEGRKKYARRKKEAGIKKGHAGGQWAERRVKEYEAQSQVSI